MGRMDLTQAVARQQFERDNLREIDKEDIPYRVLSMAGGGIYGLFTATMLRKLCEKDETFLKDDQITVFAGTSAGAILALLLAKEKNPRDAVESGELENFFKDSRVYTNNFDPVKGFLSLFGLAAWSGQKDFEHLLEEVFGDLTMEDLHHRVVVTTFDYVGTPGMKGRSWQTRNYFNFPRNRQDAKVLVRHVAYSSASIPGGRPILDGIVDGAAFAMDPTMVVLSKVMDDLREEEQQEGVFGKLSVLSLGVGAKAPYYHKANVDIGVELFNRIPTNPALRFYSPPIVNLLFDPGTDSTREMVTQMLGKGHFHYLNPPVIGFPVPPILPAVYLARFWGWRKYIILQIESQIDRAKEQIDQAVSDTVDWLSRAWNTLYRLTEEDVEALMDVEPLDLPPFNYKLRELTGRYYTGDQLSDAITVILEKNYINRNGQNDYLSVERRFELKNLIWRKFSKRIKPLTLSPGNLLTLRDENQLSNGLLEAIAENLQEFDNTTNRDEFFKALEWVCLNSDASEMFWEEIQASREAILTLARAPKTHYGTQDQHYTNRRIFLIDLRNYGLDQETIDLLQKKLRSPYFRTPEINSILLNALNQRKEWICQGENYPVLSKILRALERITIEPSIHADNMEKLRQEVWKRGPYGLSESFLNALKAEDVPDELVSAFYAPPLMMNENVYYEFQALDQFLNVQMQDANSIIMANLRKVIKVRNSVLVVKVTNDNVDRILATFGQKEVGDSTVITELMLEDLKEHLPEELMDNLKQLQNIEFPSSVLNRLLDWIMVSSDYNVYDSGDYAYLVRRRVFAGVRPGERNYFLTQEFINSLKERPELAPYIAPLEHVLEGKQKIEFTSRFLSRVLDITFGDDTKERKLITTLLRQSELFHSPQTTSS